MLRGYHEMSPASHYRHCPRCGGAVAEPIGGNVFTCGACGFRLYFNPAAAVAVFINGADGRMLFVVRAKDPGRGRLAPPGGFVDFDESAETAVRRETREEVGLELQALRFVGSHTNEYLYGDVRYPVLDLFFAADVVPGTEAQALDDVAAVRWLDPAGVAPEDLAFPSMQAAFRQLRQLRQLRPPPLSHPDL